MPEISSLTRVKPVDAVLDLGDGESVTIRFDANKVTPAWVAHTEARLNDRDVLSVPKALAEVILSWDVTDNGAPWPATSDNLAAFSFPAMSVFFEAIMEAAVPGVAEGNASSLSVSEPPSATSTPTQASSLNGSDTSSSQTSSTVPQLS